MNRRRSTATLTLVLIGAATLHGCGGDEEQATRDVYRTRADCQRDWGDDPKKCEQQGSGNHSGLFYGPMYGFGRSGSSSGGNSTGLAPRQGSNAVSSTTVSRASGSGSTSRGGFGSSASAHSSSSSS